MSSRFDRRTVLSLLATGTQAAVAGCQTVLDGNFGADSGISLQSRSPVGSPFPVELPDRGAGSTATVQITATDSRGERFERTVERAGSRTSTGFPWREFRGADPVPFAERSERSTPMDVTEGVGGDGPVRMPLYHLDPVGDPSPGHFVADASLSDAAYEHDVTVSVRDDDGVLASATGTRYGAGSAVVERGTLPDDLVGTLYAPESRGPFPGVVLLHGSGGYDLIAQSRMLAAHGYAVLMLKYFGEPGLAPSLDDIPLEYFERAVEWLTGRGWVSGPAVGLVGYSRGVEAALLTAAGLERPATVVGYTGSGLTFFGLPEDGGTDDGSDTLIPEPAGWESAWTRDGEPVTPASVVEEAIRKVGAFQDPAVREAGIPVEDIDGPVLLLSGRDDDLWASPALSEYANWRLDHHDHPHPHEHVAYRDAGHVFTLPYLAYDDTVGDRYGGTPTGNARAAADAWVRTLEYLAAGLRAR